MTGDTVIATDKHPFWVPELGQWVDAIDLAPGMWLQTSAGTWVQITAIQAWTQAATVHNLTVQDQHTYYALAGETTVLVHNKNCPIDSVIGPAGETLPLPKGAVGTPSATGKGWVYDIPTGTEGLDPRVVQVRVMDPVTTGKYQYPNGYVVYMNRGGQSVNPLNGQTVGKADPYNHIPIP
ncbi:polymorphic toxin-type HINT domain-containing protein [Thermobifida halotolerans]|uniref:polymorphic toxin-type HINT domain-containing protein n=1 Tax=Thermobifida halotolerans TaxID=483545 RepID=UPI0008396D67|nr:polymorphic toxin-type HINT domain-containing protein [Thermobifida halotolerans]